MKDKIIIGLHGPNGVGKTTVARALSELAAENGLTSERISLADPFYAMLDTLFAMVGYPGLDMRDQAFKASRHGILQDQTGRHALQGIAQAWGRDHLGPDMWVNICMHRIDQSPADMVIVDDIAQINEEAAISRAGGYTVQLIREGVAYKRNHPTTQPVTCAMRAANITPEACAKNIFDAIHSAYATNEGLQP